MQLPHVSDFIRRGEQSESSVGMVDPDGQATSEASSLQPSQTANFPHSIVTVTAAENCMLNGTVMESRRVDFLIPFLLLLSGALFCSGCFPADPNYSVVSTQGDIQQALFSFDSTAANLEWPPIVEGVHRAVLTCKASDPNLAFLGLFPFAEEPVREVIAEYRTATNTWRIRRPAGISGQDFVAADLVCTLPAARRRRRK